MRLTSVLQVLLPMLLALGALAAPPVELPLPPSPTQWVTDEAKFIAPSTRATLNERLEAFEHASGHQVIVWIGKTNGGLPIEDWAAKVFAQWKVGRKGLDDGLVLFILADDHKLRIEVGYGLEGDIPDARAARIIGDTIVPAIKAGENDKAVTEGTDAILQTLRGLTPELKQQLSPAHAPPPSASSRFGNYVMWTLMALFVIFAIRHPSLAFWFLLNIMSSSGRSSRGGFGGGFSGGGGGFSGGGGRSGGGGASGSW